MAGRGFAALRVGVALACLPKVAFAETAGFRTDGTGRYPDARPVLERSATKNVVWKTPLPNWSNATPVIAGSRIFVCSEPATLVCVNLADGKILWQESSNYDEIGSSEAENARAREAMKRAEALKREMNGVNRKLRGLRKRLKKNPNDESLKAQAKRLDEEMNALKKRLEPDKDYVVPSTNGANGYSSATPVTDGRRVFAVFGTGIVAAFDVGGRRLWAKRLESPPTAGARAFRPCSWAIL